MDKYHFLLLDIAHLSLNVDPFDIISYSSVVTTSKYKKSHCFAISLKTISTSLSFKYCKTDTHNPN